MHSVCIWYSCHACLPFWIHSIVENLSLGPRSVWRIHTPKAVGSRHLCFESQHSYYGFHVACKVLCICFDHSLFGMPPHIKMLGIHPLRTNKPCQALFLRRHFAVKDGGSISNRNLVIIVFKDTDKNCPCKIIAVRMSGMALHLLTLALEFHSLMITISYKFTAAVCFQCFTFSRCSSNVPTATDFCLNCLWDLNMCLTLVSIPQENKPLLFTEKKKSALHCIYP